MSLQRHINSSIGSLISEKEEEEEGETKSLRSFFLRSKEHDKFSSL